MKYLYPAVFTRDDQNDVYLVDFPDIEGCYTDGKTAEEAAINAQDVLSLMLWELEESKAKIPAVSKPFEIKTGKKKFITYIMADTTEYRKKMNKRVVKKTLTIPEWLDTLAKENNINFSSVLQEALKQRLNV